MTSPERLSRRGLLRGALAVSGAAALGACSTESGEPAPTTNAPGASSTPASPADSWEARPVERVGLSSVASQAERQLLLHTAGGDVSFWGGVGLSATMPGRQAGTQTATAQDYRRWFPMMAGLGVRFVRADTIHPPAMYAELRSYNLAHPQAPLYLVQTIRPTIAAGTASLFDRKVVAAVSSEIADASKAVHGTLRRAAARGGAARATGTWNADVSAWTAAWILGADWDPTTVRRTDDGARRTPAHEGRYVSSNAQASPTEHWMAARLDELATLEAAHGLSVPVAFGNTPETDPLEHPEEPDPAADLVGIDATHVFPTAAWPGGTFAAYAAHPYRPSFIRLQSDYQQTGDAYRAYLQQLHDHHESMPLLLHAFGVPTSYGSAGEGPGDVDGGHHSEQDAMQLQADMLRMFDDIDLAGGFLTAWHDDWSASTWNTVPRQEPVAPARRPLVHDPLTADQWHGLLAHDSARVGERTVHEAPNNELKRVTFDHDASWAYLTLFFGRRVTSPVEIGFDYLADGGLRLPGGSGRPIHDIALRCVPTMSTTIAYIRSALDPTRLDGLPSGWWALPEDGGWNTQSLTVTGTYVVPGTTQQVSPTFQKVGELVLGVWDTTNPDYDSLATWHLGRESADQSTALRFRLPWGMLGMADASARSALVPAGFRPATKPVPSMLVTVESSTPGSPVTFPLSWAVWNSVSTTERLKAGTSSVRDALVAVSRRGDLPGA